MATFVPTGKPSSSICPSIVRFLGVFEINVPTVGFLRISDPLGSDRHSVKFGALDKSGHFVKKDG